MDVSAHSVRAWSGEAAELEAAAELYANVFSEPPYDEDPNESRATFLDRVERYANLPHFRLLLARRDDDVVGLALGNGIAAGDWWRDRILPQLPADVGEEWFGDEAFAVVELATVSAHRRSGVASALLARLVDGLPYPAAVLSAYAAADEARLFYRRQGWTELAAGVRLGDAPELCLFGLHLTPQPGE